MNSIKRVGFISLIGFFALMLAVMFAPQAFAKDVILDTEIQTVTVALDKNGNEYARLIITEPRTLQGVAYTVTVPVMCFGEMVAQAKDFQSGDQLKAIAQTNEYKGRTNYNIIAFIE